ncbi:MAG: hypothetical protein ACRD51_17525 [Candidatus Acidiferrum sp.]
MAKPEPEEIADKREMSKGRAALLIFVSGLTAVVSALELHGWHVYLALGIVGVGLAIGFLRWSRK